MSNTFFTQENIPEGKGLPDIYLWETQYGHLKLHSWGAESAVGLGIQPWFVGALTLRDPIKYLSFFFWHNIDTGELPTLFPLRSGTHKHAHSHHAHSIVLEVQAMAIRQKKVIKAIQVAKKEVELSLFAGDMILYIENPTRNY